MAPESHPITNFKQTYLLRLPGILDGRHPLAGSQPEISFPEETQGMPIVHPEDLAAGMGEGISHILQIGVTTLAKELVT